jgi:CBS domain-containing protein
MVAAPRMDLLNIDAPYDEMLHQVITTAHSRFPVYQGERENIIGILLAKDLLKLQRAPELNMRALLRPPVFVPESKGLNDLLREFRANRNHLAIVIDEFGRVAGLVTIEDVLEEIVGEIEDEFDIEGDEATSSPWPTTATAWPATRPSSASTRPSACTWRGPGRRPGRRVRHHRRADRPRDGPCAQPRRALQPGRAGLRGAAHQGRRGALVQGLAHADGRRVIAALIALAAGALHALALADPGPARPTAGCRGSAWCCWWPC